MAGKKKTTETEAVKAAETMAAGEEVKAAAEAEKPVEEKKAAAEAEKPVEEKFCRQKNHSGKEKCCS